MVGHAFTLRYIPMREDLEEVGEFNNLKNKQRIAVERVEPGDVLVIDARGDDRAGVLGNILATRIRERGGAGIVTDGAFRDTPVIRAMRFPTYARGQSPNLSSAIHYPADVNVPIACGGVAVMPGDVLVGDGEGVIAIPRAVVEPVAHQAYEQEAKEEFLLSKIEAGSSIVGVYPPNETVMREYEARKLGGRAEGA
jgi:regulator of RNase E activity RraA